MEFQEFIEVDDYSCRTDDVKTQGSFESLMISPSTIVNLRNRGYRIPSPVQMKAIPTGLTGLDMLVQAKSGTGKTLVFSILAVENLNLQSSEVQKMIIAPTREIATQIKDTIKMIAHFKTRIALLVGGTPVHLDVQALKRGAHIVVGTAGRICQMVQNGNLNMDCIDLFVLDEADKLMDDCFQKDINYLFSALPPSRQVAVFSATYPRDLDKLLAKFMRDASLVRLNSGDVQLIGIKQYVVMCSEPALDLVLRLLKSVHFNQALIFCNHHQQCEPTCVHLEDAGFLSACISAQLPQTQRDAVIEKLKQNKLKVLVSTDLTARGIDAVNVDLVINLGSAVNVETYFHRIGRAARFGGYGAAVTLLSDFREASRFKTIALEGDLNVRILDSKRIPPDLTTNQTYFESCTHFKVGHGSNSEIRETANSKTSSICLSYIFLSILSFQGRVKFRFVPSFQKKKRFFYMRGELLKIRESLNEATWRDYALSRFDMSHDPFLPCDQILDRQKKKLNKTCLVWLIVLKIFKVWLSYAKARWDTSEEPFQLDQYMRCSFEEQLRRQRQLEKKQRSRLKAQLEKPKILAFARTYSKMPVCETSFDSFCDRINNDFQEYRKKQGLTSCGLGPVVSGIY
uniref:RNA helicase n=1 Tax=Angiostrongylus cantonensis TaxID=6313 RepID=A0A0K0CX66_ANGCA